MFRPRTSPSAPQTIRPAQLVLLCGLSLVAAFLWSRPCRENRWLQTAPLSELQTRARTSPPDSRLLYALGTRARGEGRSAEAYDAFAQAAELDENDEKSWLAAAQTAEGLHGEQGAFDLIATFLKKNPGSASAHLALAVLYQKRQVHKRAYEEASEASRLDPKNAEAWRITGIEAMAWNRIPEAEAALRRAVAENKSDPRNQLGLGDAVFEQHRVPEAIALYREAVRLAPEEAAGYLSLGRALLSSDPAGAQNALRDSLKRNPAIPIAHFLLGKSFAGEGRWKEAREPLEMAKRLSPQDPAAAFELGRVYRRLGETLLAAHEEKRYTALSSLKTEKQELLQRITAVEKENGDPQEMRLKLARLCAGNGDLTEAAYHYRKLLERHPSHPAAQRELSRLVSPAGFALGELPRSASSSLERAERFLAQKSYAEAERGFVRVLEQNETSARALLGLGLALEAQGKPEKAVVFLNRALQQSPGLAQPPFLLAKHFLEAGFPKKAQFLLQKAVKADPSRADCWHLLGTTCLNSDLQTGEAEAAFREAVRLAPGEAAFGLDFAETLAKHQKPAEAEAAYRTALRLLPDSPEAKSRFGVFLASSGASPDRMAEAKRLLQESLAKDPTNDFTLYGLGKLRLEQGRPAEAITALKTALKHTRQMDVAVIWYTLSRAYGRLGDAPQEKRAAAQSQRLRDEYQALLGTEEQLFHQPSDPELNLKAARLYAKHGDTAQALSGYEKCAVLAPKSGEIKREGADYKARLKAAGKLPNLSLFYALLSLDLH